MPESPQHEQQQKQNYSQALARPGSKVENINRPRKCFQHKAIAMVKAPVPLRPSANSAALAKHQQDQRDDFERTFKVFQDDLHLELEGTLSELISSFNMPTLEKSPSPQCHKADFPLREPNPRHKVLLHEYPAIDKDSSLGLFCASPVTYVKDDEDVFNM